MQKVPQKNLEASLPMVGESNESFNPSAYTEPQENPFDFSPNENRYSMAVPTEDIHSGK